ncbi:Fc.00g091110.m01.CDS01 [Cosmosporella sp. VM-42]
MPIFQADLDHEHEDPVNPRPAVLDIPATRLRRLSEESIRTELCEGPVPDSPQPPNTPRSDDETAISDRVELIERLKRGESPTWIPNRHVNRLALQTQHSPTDYTSPREPILQSFNSVTSPKRSQSTSNLLPPAQITPEKKELHSEVDERLRDGLSIERPRSALHSGDFTEDEAAVDRRKGQGDEGRHHDNHPIQPEGPWIATSPPRHFTPFQFERRAPFSGSTDGFRSGTSPLSSSLSSSFIYKPPTSPLVQSESNEELDLSMPLDGIGFASNRAGSRRYTVTSSASSPYFSPSPLSNMPTRVPSYRREAYQAHQPRRSLTSTPSFANAGTSPQSPAFLRSRRSSLVSDSSPLHHASMVGSYEESILRGRMSTTPSKPLDFLAQIGVLGKGKCKSSLKCPPHVTLSFPAVYYSYSSTSHGRSRSDDGPSPYVGQIDLENGLPNQEDSQRSKRKAQSRHAERRHGEDEMDLIMHSQTPDNEPHRNSRSRHRSGSPKAPPGGSYRIPEKGQIQIIIKNPNKTAVKLFLVPYDLTGMEPGTKTFIRQRSYSAGPIIDNVPPSSDLDSSDRPILRYLVHLHICCPAKGRFFLYKSIRIVFANRVPDGKEKLRNETTWPEPRFTPYKPVRVMHPVMPAPSGPGAMLAAEKAFRRRSSGFSLYQSTQTFDLLDSVHQPSNRGIGSSGGFAAGNTIPVDPIPFQLPSSRNRLNSDVSNATTNTTGPEGIRSPGSSQASRPSTKDSAGAGPWGATLYEKLNKGDLGYGGNAFSIPANGSPAGAEGLLSQRLRSLGVKGQNQNQEVNDEETT